jgi:hypothetical protein
MDAACFCLMPNECPGSYIDNLALCDNTLGELKATLAETLSASLTTLIISSDPNGGCQSGAIRVSGRRKMKRHHAEDSIPGPY